MPINVGPRLSRWFFCETIQGGRPESVTRRTSIQWIPAITRILRPLPRQLHRRHWLHVPAEAAIGTPRHLTVSNDLAIACHLSADRCHPGSPANPLSRPIQGHPNTTQVHGCATKVVIDRLKPAYVMHSNIETARPWAILCVRHFLGGGSDCRITWGYSGFCKG